eukprot:8964674-Pyramimonas_sp.AAC.1
MACPPPRVVQVAARSSWEWNFDAPAHEEATEGPDGTTGRQSQECSHQHPREDDDQGYLGAR